MNRRIEDRIAMLAFGELSEKEAAEVRALASKDPEAARLLKSYEAMRTGLSDLRELPADQLSKERLQDAILGQGLKPGQRSPWLGWMWAPAGAVAAMFLMVLLLKPTDLIPEPSNRGVDFATLTEAPLNLDPSVTESPLEAIRGGREVERAIDRTEGMMAMHAEATAAIRPQPASESTDTPRRPSTRRSSPRSLVVAEPSYPQATEGPIVLIQNEMDYSTGARRAIETESIADVVVAS